MNDKKIEELIKALGDSDFDVRRYAAEALKKIGVPAAEPFIKMLRDRYADVRWHAAEILGKIGDARAVEPLIRALGDSDWLVRSNAAEALGEIGDVRAVEPLIKALENKNSDDRASAADALGMIGDVRAIEPLIRALRDKNSDVRVSAAYALGEMGDARAVEPLIRALGNKNSDARVSAAYALREIGDARAVEPLIRILGDSDSDVRRRAAEALDKLHWSPANDTEKANYLTAKQDWESVILLGVPAVDSLIKLLRDENSDIKNKATELLEKFCSQIIEIIFGEIPSNNSRNTIKNVDISQLTVPMSSLTKITISADTYDFNMVERFITYAINYVGQKHLKKKVEVYIYGNPDKLHPNLLNSFKNLCRKVIIQGNKA